VGHVITAKAKAPLITVQDLRLTLTVVSSIDANCIALSANVQRSCGSIHRGDMPGPNSKTPTPLTEKSGSWGTVQQRERRRHRSRASTTVYFFPAMKMLGTGGAGMLGLIWNPVCGGWL
jgi:hypothetical protein